MKNKYEKTCTTIIEQEVCRSCNDEFDGVCFECDCPLGSLEFYCDGYGQHVCKYCAKELNKKNAKETTNSNNP